MNLEYIYKHTKVPPCGHEKLVTECNYCWIRAFTAMKQIHAEEEEVVNESRKNSKKAIAFSRLFNRRGCPYCGGIF